MFKWIVIGYNDDMEAGRFEITGSITWMKKQRTRAESIPGDIAFRLWTDYVVLSWDEERGAYHPVEYSEKGLNLWTKTVEGAEGRR